MEKETSQWWISIYNSLYLLGINKTKLALLKTDFFDPLDELESAIDLGFCKDSLNYISKLKWIDLEMKEKLIKFKSFIDSIPAKNWNYYDYDSNEDWILAKKWANYLFNELGFEDNGWNNQGEIIIYTDE